MQAKPRLKKQVNPPETKACTGCMFSVPGQCGNSRAPACVVLGEAWVWINVAKGNQAGPDITASPVEQEQV